MPSPLLSKAKILYLVTEDWYFWSHRLPMARAARDLGFEVLVAARVNQHREKIEGEGFRLIDLPLERKGKNPFGEVTALRAITRIYRDEKPDLVHHPYSPAPSPLDLPMVPAWSTPLPEWGSCLSPSGE